mgnify:CR=1 FL=1
MSRNTRRTQIPKTQEPEIQPQEQFIPPEEPNPFGISFVVPTELVYLPSGGEFYEPGNPVLGLEMIEIKAMTAKEEDILINDSFIEQGIVFDRLLDSLIVTPDVKAAHLLDCDKVALLVCARKSGYGATVPYHMVCSECGESSEVEINLQKMLENTKDNRFKIESTSEWDYDTTSGTLSFELPVTGITVRIKMLSRSDTSYLKEDKARRESMNLPYNETIEFLRRILVSADSVTDKGDLAKLLEVLPAADARRMKYVHNVNIPRFDTRQTIECPACSAKVEKEVPFSVGWFWSI